MNILEHMGYHGTVEVDMDRGVLHGKILFIADLVTYTAQAPNELKQEFEAAINDYLQTCAELGREPMQPASGSFNVRTGPDRHRAAQIRATADGVSLNEVMLRALDCYLHQSREVRETRVEKHYIALESQNQKTLLIPFEGSDIGEVRHVLQ